MFQPAADRTIYLTFDDGPGEGTPHVLDVLKQYGVRYYFTIEQLASPLALKTNLILFQNFNFEIYNALRT